MKAPALTSLAWFCLSTLCFTWNNASAQTSPPPAITGIPGYKVQEIKLPSTLESTANPTTISIAQMARNGDVLCNVQTTSGAYRPFIVRNGVSTAIDIPSSIVSATGQKINESGMVAGVVITSVSPLRFQVFTATSDQSSFQYVSSGTITTSPNVFALNILGDVIHSISSTKNWSVRQTGGSYASRQGYYLHYLDDAGTAYFPFYNGSTSFLTMNRAKTKWSNLLAHSSLNAGASSLSHLGVSTDGFLYGRYQVTSAGSTTYRYFSLNNAAPYQIQGLNPYTPFTTLDTTGYREIALPDDSYRKLPAQWIEGNLYGRREPINGQAARLWVLPHGSSGPPIDLGPWASSQYLVYGQLDAQLALSQSSGNWGFITPGVPLVPLTDCLPPPTGSGPLTYIPDAARVSRTGHLLATVSGSTKKYLATPVQDSDQDRMPDEWELAHYLNPNNAADKNLDNDSDWLTNHQEFLAGTNLADPDTDDDGISDGLEVQFALNPLDPNDVALDSDGDQISNMDEVLILGQSPFLALYADPVKVLDYRAHHPPASETSDLFSYIRDFNDSALLGSSSYDDYAGMYGWAWVEDWWVATYDNWVMLATPWSVSGRRAPNYPFHDSFLGMWPFSYVDFSIFPNDDGLINGYDYLYYSPSILGARQAYQGSPAEYQATFGGMYSYGNSGNSYSYPATHVTQTAGSFYSFPWGNSQMHIIHSANSNNVVLFHDGDGSGWQLGQMPITQNPDFSITPMGVISSYPNDFYPTGKCLNNANQVTVNRGYNAFLRDPHGYEDPITYPGASQVFAHTLNDKGVVAAHYQKPSGESGGFLWSATQGIISEFPVNYYGDQILALNNKNYMLRTISGTRVLQIGTYTIPVASLAGGHSVYINDTWQTLELDPSSVRFLNNKNQLAGIAYTPSYQSFPVIIDLNFDINDNGIPDDWERLRGYGAGYNPYVTDTDGDGFSDWDEFNTSHTLAANADSDGDGCTDWEELNISHTNPLDASSHSLKVVKTVPALDTTGPAAERWRVEHWYNNPVLLYLNDALPAEVTSIPNFVFTRQPDNSLMETPGTVTILPGRKVIAFVATGGFAHSATAPTRFVIDFTTEVTGITPLMPLVGEFYTATQAKDEVGPWVGDVEPGASYIDADFDLIPTAKWSQPLSPASLITANATFINLDTNTPVPYTLEFDYPTGKMTLRPTAPYQPYTRYEISLGTGFTNLSGVPLQHPQTWHFRSRAVRPQPVPGQGPYITMLSPEDYNFATIFPPDFAVRVTFSEPMDPATLTTDTVHLIADKRSEVNCTLTYDANSRTLSLVPVTRLEPIIYYEVKFDAAEIKSAAATPQSLQGRTLSVFSCY